MIINIKTDTFSNNIEQLTIEPSELGKLLKERFNPQTTRVYQDDIDITPTCENDIRTLLECTEITVIEHPSDPITVGFVILGIVVASVAVAFIFRPSAPVIDPATAPSNQQRRSPNNSLSGKQNTVRIGQRIADIYGSVRAYPDLIASPYRKFINNVEFEFAYMCIGRGSFSLSSSDILDGDTPAEQISGTDIELYDINTSPNSGSPQILIGSAITEPLVETSRVQNVDGIHLQAPNEVSFLGGDDVFFTATDRCDRASGATVDFTTVMNNGDSITISNAVWDSGAGPGAKVRFNGQYIVKTGSITASKFEVDDPNFGWEVKLAALGPVTDDLSDVNMVQTDEANYIGPFFVSDPDATKIICNFVATNGLYEDDGVTRTSLNVDIEIEVTPVNEDFADIGPIETFEITLEGDASGETGPAQIGVTLEATPSFTGRAKVRARRLTDTTLSGTSTVVDTVKWKDLYSSSPVNETDFGEVTTVYVSTENNSQAISGKARKLSMDVIRIIETFDNLGVSQGNVASEFGRDIYIATALDQFIGRLTVDDIDFAEIFEQDNAIAVQFSNDDARKFNWTFDDDQISFEEMAEAVCTAIFSFPNRSGNLLSMLFEGLNTVSTLLFNHRNKIPDTEVRTVSFGNINDYDGVEAIYTSPIDGARLSITVGATNPVNPKKLETVGVNSSDQATWHAHRAFQKIVFNYETLRFSATSEANLLRRSNRIAVTDDTQGGLYSGTVDDVNGVAITLSQIVPDDVDTTWVIFLQLFDGTVIAEQILTIADNIVTIGVDLELSLSFVETNYAIATYTLVEQSTQDVGTAFIVTETDTSDNQRVGVNAINYDSRYYDFDGV